MSKTLTFVPFTSLCRLLVRSFGDVISMAFGANPAPSASTKPVVTVKPVEAAVAPAPETAIAPAATPQAEQNVTTMDLNGHEYQFIQSTADQVVTVKKQVYQSKLTEHPQLGRKLLPTNGLKWTELTSYQGVDITQAIEQFIHDGLQHKPASTMHKAAAIDVPLPAAPLKDVTTVVKPAVAASADPHRDVKPTVGKLIEKSDRKFPDKAKPGKTYQNYAITLATNYGDRVLQGEGLRDAIAVSGADIGDKLQVRRLDQIDVQLVDKVSGKPLFDGEGNPKMGKKWQWDITLTK